MAKQTVQGLMLQKLDSLEKKVDKLATEIVPTIMTQVAVNSQITKDEAKSQSRIHSMIWGVITLTVSLAGIAVAYFKH